MGDQAMGVPHVYVPTEEEAQVQVHTNHYVCKAKDVKLPAVLFESLLVQVSVTALWFNRVTGSEKGVAQLLAHKVFSSTTLGF